MDFPSEHSTLEREGGDEREPSIIMPSLTKFQLSSPFLANVFTSHFQQVSKGRISFAMHQSPVDLEGE